MKKTEHSDSPKATKLHISKNEVKKILVVEDFPELQKAIKTILINFFGKHTEVLIAGTLEEAEKLFEDHRNLDLIFLDTSLGKGITTFGFAKKITKVFNGSVVAISSDDDYRRHMVTLGCTYECGKESIYNFIQEYFKK